MGFFDIVAAALPWSESEAEAVKGGASTSTPTNSADGGEGEAKVCCFLFYIPIVFSIRCSGAFEKSMGFWGSGVVDWAN
jgi:hypothetical protein